MARIADRSRVTIKDVARAANVSVTTVSDALSGNGRLTAKTRSRVRAVADNWVTDPVPPRAAWSVHAPGCWSCRSAHREPRPPRCGVSTSSST
ncbi:LacI family DNA-binding transcriptional regulator [Mycobacterium arosiense]|uniref:LacI family DNA-binding transcriptional regulator n=1 Tax=Mycobacterium arosiense TaxID=425468 RepID=UPI0009F29836